MTIYEFRDYKIFLKRWIASQPNEGRGILSRISEHLSLTPGMLSHVVNGDKHLSLEAGNDLAAFLTLANEETEYLLLMIQFARAGSHSLRVRFETKLRAEQKKATELVEKMKPDRELTDAVKSVFYSNWLYSGVRNLSACPGFSDVDAMAEHLKVPRVTVQRVMDFLLQNGLCVIKKGRIGVGPAVTHTGSQTPLVQKHHQNWRLQAINKMSDIDERNVFFTSPMSLSKETAEAIRLKIPSFVEEVRKLVGPSESEVVRCLNIDWFHY